MSFFTVFNRLNMLNFCITKTKICRNKTKIFLVLPIKYCLSCFTHRQSTYPNSHFYQCLGSEVGGWSKLDGSRGVVEEWKMLDD